MEKEKCCGCPEEQDICRGECMCHHSPQKESEWEKEFDEKYNHDDPNGKALVLIQSNEVGHSQYPAQEMIKHFIRNAIATAVSTREKEIAEEVEKLPRFSAVSIRGGAVSIRGGKEMVLKEQVLSIIKH